MKENLKKINNKYVRLIAWIVVAINTGALILDIELLPFDNDQIVKGISLVALYAIEAWNHWKNNSYTKSAKEADVYLESRKKKSKIVK